MQVVKKQNYSVRYNEKKSLLDLPSVNTEIGNKFLRVARLSIGRTIAEIPDRDIRIENGEEKDYGLVKEVQILVSGIAKDYGIKKVERSEAFRFYDILKKYYSNLTLDEVRTAFELALIGELDKYLPKDKNGDPDKNSYQNFSVEFFTKILKAYNQFKGTVWSRIYSISSKELGNNIEKDLEKIEKEFRSTVKEFYENYLQTGRIEVVLPIYVSDYLIKKGLAEKKELEEIHFKKAKLLIDLNKNVNPFDKIGANLEARLNTEARTILAKEIIKESFDKLKNEGIRNDYWD